ncbi:MAG: TIGR04150 pseudo-rSAM protein [Bacteroidota bacterium]|nr:TIGR04150 pseudo-rSAM protein [Bacteroidota bacterium]
MMAKETVTEYWFNIEPYVYIGLTNKCVLLYNTLDSVTIESDKSEVIELLQETLQKENYGVILLSEKRLQNKNINAFITELREKYMGDIIDATLSKGKPIQLTPFFNFSDTDQLELYKKHNLSSDRNMLEKLSEISIHVDNTTNIRKLISFLQSVPDKLTFNIIGNLGRLTNYKELLSFLNQCSSPKNIFCSYKSVIPLQPAFENEFMYRIVVDFPIHSQFWDNSMQILRNQTLPFEYVFNVSSLSDCQKSEQLIEQFRIERYQFKPVFIGDNMHFFKENVFLSKEDILSTHISIKNIFANQSINIFDFGKINIMPNGDVFSNVNHPPIGDIYTSTIFDLVRKEIFEGKSWLRIRNQAPCNKCVYQWLCPSPSDYEIAIGRPNLCKVIQQ